MEILHQLQLTLWHFAPDILRSCIQLLILIVIFTPLELLCSIHAKQILRKAWLTDLAYYFLNGLFSKSLLVLPTTWLALLLAEAIPAEVRAWGTGLSLPARIAATMLVGEIGYYWGHRWMHEIPWLWRFHAIHHSAEGLDWLVNTRAHPVDMMFTRLCGFVPMYALGLVQPLGKSLDWVLLMVIFIGLLWGFFIHANLRWRFGWLEWLISTPAFHHWHHNKEGFAYYNKNYAPMLPCIDLIFGTFYLPKKQWPSLYGITEAMPANMLRQLLEPFAFRKR